MNCFESRLLTALGAAAGKVYLAAVSGGADSFAMLATLAALRSEVKFSLHCIHVDHGIRPPEESGGDAQAVLALCETYGVPCRLIKIPPGKIAAFAAKGGPGIEGAARIFRHRALNDERRRIAADSILTAHTRDDLLENILMGILRGAGPAGLSTMPRRRGFLLRPLLDFTREEVLEYLKDKGIPYRTDSTNSDRRFFRNRVRLDLVPLLDASFPSWRKTILTFAETQALAADFLSSESEKRLTWEKEEGRLKLNKEEFLKAPLIIREEAIFKGVDILSALGTRIKSRRQVPRRTTVRRAALNGSGDLGPARLETKNASLEMALKDSGERGFSLLITEPGTYTLNGKVLGLSRDKELSIKVRAAAPSAAPTGAGAEKPTAAPEATETEIPKDVPAFFHGGLPMVFRKHREGDRLKRGGHERRFSDILNGRIRSFCRGVITACDADGLSAFIAIGSDLSGSPGNVLVIAGDGAKSGASRSGDLFYFEFGGLDV